MSSSMVKSTPAKPVPSATSSGKPIPWKQDALEFGCTHCEQSFDSQTALASHKLCFHDEKSTASFHTTPAGNGTSDHVCGMCQRSFKSKEALSDHKKSPKHSQSKTQKHRQASPTHTTTSQKQASGQEHQCVSCKSTFGSKTALDSHQCEAQKQGSPPPETTAQKYQCLFCCATFPSSAEFAAHNEDFLNCIFSNAAGSEATRSNGGPGTTVSSPAPQTAKSSISFNVPLAFRPKPKAPHKKTATQEMPTRHFCGAIDDFFLSFSDFPYDPDRSPNEAFCALGQFYNWQPDSKEREKAKRAFRIAVEADFVHIREGRTDPVQLPGESRTVPSYRPSFYQAFVPAEDPIAEQKAWRNTD